MTQPPGVWALIRSDYLRHYRHKAEPAARLRLLMAPRLVTNASIQATILVRLLLASPRWAAWLWRRILLSHHGIDWAYDSEVGPGLQLPHPTGIVIGAGVVMHENVVIHQHVTISPIAGSRWTRDQGLRHLYIGNDTVIYPHTIILGEITIGVACVVGAMQCLRQSLANGTTYTARTPLLRSSHNGEPNETMRE